MSSRYFYSPEIEDTLYVFCPFFFLFLFFPLVLQELQHTVGQSINGPDLQLIAPNSVAHNMRTLFFFPVILSFIPLEAEAVHMNLTSLRVSGHILETREENPFNIEDKIERKRENKKKVGISESS